MVDLTELPMMKDNNPEETARRIWGNLVQEGRNAYRMLIDISRCPPYRLLDMTIAWKLGWRWEAEEDLQRYIRAGKIKEAEALSARLDKELKEWENDS